MYGNYGLQFPKELNIIGVAEPIAIRNKRYAKKHTIVDENRFDTWEHVFDRPKFADAVIISTNWINHAPMAKESMLSGAHTFVEVPLALRLEDLWELVDISEATQKHCMMMENVNGD